MKREDSLLFALRFIIAVFMLYLGVMIIKQGTGDSPYTGKGAIPVFIGITLILMAIGVLIGGIYVLYQLENEKHVKCANQRLN